MCRAKFLSALRNWCAGLGVVMLALALTSVSNSVANPETWSSVFRAMAASGAFAQYAGWFLAIGAGFLFIAVLAALYLKRLER